jgi:hypothetical protein
MTLRVVALCLLAAGFMSVAGCGDAGTSTEQTTAATVGAPKGVSGDDRRGECARKGLFGRHIVVSRDAEGLCRARNGQLVTLVRFGRVARLRDLSFEVNGAHTAARLSGGPVGSRAHGAFVVVSITLTNTSGDTQRVSNNQFRLEMDLRLHGADREAALGGDNDSLIFQTLRGLPPGATVTGDVIFDVPRRLAPTLIDGGFITGFSFATVDAGHPLPDSPAGASPLSE